jgi:hypothetical protein
VSLVITCTCTPASEPTNLLHAEEGEAREARVGAGLVLRPNPLHAEVVGHLLQPAFERLAALHEVLDVVHHREVDAARRRGKWVHQQKKENDDDEDDDAPHELEKFFFAGRHVLARQQPHEVAKVIATVRVDRKQVGLGMKLGTRWRHTCET